MKNTTQSIIGWCAGLAIGMAMDLSQNNLILGIGLGAAFGASLGHLQMKKKKFLKRSRVAPQSWGFFCLFSPYSSKSI